MLPVVNSALCLFYLALLFFVFSPPLRVHCSLSLLVAWTPLNSDSKSTLTSSTVFVHGFSHSVPMPVRFLFHLRQFTFCSCAWSSLFNAIIINQGVATCPPINGASLLHWFVSSVTSWMSSSSTVAVKRIPNPFRTWLNSLSIPLLSIGRNLSHPIWALQIRRHTHVSRG